VPKLRHTPGYGHKLLNTTFALIVQKEQIGILYPVYRML